MRSNLRHFTDAPWGAEMATPSTDLKVWFENQAPANIAFDSTMRVSRVQMLAMQALCSNRSPPLDPRNYEIAGPGGPGLDPNSSLSTCGVTAGADLYLVEKYKQKPSDIHWAIGLGVYTGLILVAGLIAISQLWPWTSADLTPTATRSVTFYLFAWPVGTYALGPELQLLYIVILSGTIGACVWSLYALSLHMSAIQDFNRIWAAWYIVRPFLGAGLAVALYAVIRAGLFSAGSGVDDANVLGVAALSFLVGLFAENAVHQLHRVADTLFGDPADDKTTSTSTKKQS
jgi:hypothetical protein